MREKLLQKIIGKILKADKEFKLFEKKDRIAVGVSGGKDSLILLEAMGRIYKFLKFDIEIIAVTIDLGFDDNFKVYENVRKICEKFNVEYVVEKTCIADIVFNKKKEKNPCSLCSKLRKGILNSIAKEKGCNKVAFGHHFDDVVETFFMNLFVEGRISCFSPVTYFSRKDLFLIRPLVFVKEKEIIKTVKNLNFSIIKNLCPKDGKTHRQVIKNFLFEKEKEDRGFKNRIFGALRRNGLNGWSFCSQ